MPPPAHTPLAPPRAAPPPPTLPDELLDLVTSLARRLLDLEQHQVPQLAGAKERGMHEQLSGEVRREMGGVKRDVEELKLQVDDLQKSRDRRAGAEHVVAIQARLDAITKSYRQAVIASKRLIDASALSSSVGASGGFASGRDELFYSAAKAGGGLGSKKKGAEESPDDALMSATSDVTEGLRRTLQLMQQEVDRSQVSNELLESQTATLSLTSEQYSLFSTLLTTSKALITSLERADLLDRLILLAALLLFGLVCAWVFKRRVVDKGVRIASALTGVVGRAKGGNEGAGEVVKRGVEEVAAITTAVLSVVTALTGRATASSSSSVVPAAVETKAVEQEREEEEFEQLVDPRLGYGGQGQVVAPANDSRVVDLTSGEPEDDGQVDEPEPEDEQLGGGFQLEDMLEEGDEEFEGDDDAFEPEEEEEGSEMEEQLDDEAELPFSTTPVLPTEGASTFTDDDGTVWDLVPGGVLPVGAHLEDDGQPQVEPQHESTTTPAAEIPSSFPEATDVHHGEELHELPVPTATPSAAPSVEQEEEDTEERPTTTTPSATASAEPEVEFEAPTPTETSAPIDVEQTVEATPAETVAGDVEQTADATPSLPAETSDPTPDVTLDEPLPTPAEEEPTPSLTYTSSPEPSPTSIDGPTPPTPSATLDLPAPEPEVESEFAPPTEADLGFDSPPVVAVFRNTTPTAVLEEVEEKVFEPLKSLRPATPDVGDRDELVRENEVVVEEEKQEEGGELEKRDEATPEPEEELPTFPKQGAPSFIDDEGMVWDVVPGGVLPEGAVLQHDGREEGVMPSGVGYQGFEALERGRAPQEEEGEGEWVVEEVVFEEEEEEEEEEESPAPPVEAHRSAVEEPNRKPVETAAAAVSQPEASATIQEEDEVVQATQTPTPEPLVPREQDVEDPIPSSSSSAPLPSPTVDDSAPPPSPSPSPFDEATIIDPSSEEAFIDPAQFLTTDDADAEQGKEWAAVPGGEGVYTVDQVSFADIEDEQQAAAAAVEAARFEQEREKVAARGFEAEPEVVQRVEVESDVLEGVGEVEQGTSSTVEPDEAEGSVELPVEELEKAGVVDVGASAAEEDELALESEMEEPTSTVDVVPTPSATVEPIPSATVKVVLPPTEDADITSFEDTLAGDSTLEEEEEEEVLTGAVEDDELPLESDEYLGELEEGEEEEGEGVVFRDEL